jgi:hypothetical protein
MKRLFWDIEVSPNIALVWRSGWKERIPPENIIHERAIICISYKWEHEKKVRSLHWNYHQCDKTLCKKFVRVMDSADELVAHNGDKFDLKWFNARCVYHKLEAPRIPKTVDTLVIARRRFMFNSNKLDYISQFLKHGSKHETEYDLWKNILMKNCKGSLNRMVKYCEQDVRILEKVYKELAPYHNPKTHVGVVQGRDKWSCPSCGSEKIKTNGNRVSAKGVPTKQMNCKKCGRRYEISMKVFRDYQESKE